MADSGVMATVVEVSEDVAADVVPTVAVVVRFELVEYVPVPTIEPFQGLLTVGAPPASIAIGAIEVKVGSGVTVNAAITVFELTDVPLIDAVTVTS